MPELVAVTCCVTASLLSFGLGCMVGYSRGLRDAGDMLLAAADPEDAAAVVASALAHRGDRQ